MLASETSENVLFCILLAGSFSPFDSFSFSFEKIPSVLYVLKKKHRQHINNTMTPPTLFFLAS